MSPHIDWAQQKLKWVLFFAYLFEGDVAYTWSVEDLKFNAIHFYCDGGR